MFYDEIDKLLGESTNESELKLLVSFSFVLFNSCKSKLLNVSIEFPGFQISKESDS